MSEPTTERYLSSAEEFLNEALIKAVEAFNGQPRKWQFAILHLITSLELSLKARLHLVHPVLTRESIDTTKRSVTLTLALQRLKDPAIVGLRISQDAERSISSAVDLRNNLSHAISFENDKASAAKFFEVFAFLRYFLSTELNRAVNDIVDAHTLEGAQQILGQREELWKHALSLIQPHDIVWRCPECRQDFFVQRGDHFVCLYCLKKEVANSCADCLTSIPEHLLHDTSEYFEYVFEDGHSRLVRNFGIPDIKVCEGCLTVRRRQIDAIKYEEAIEDFYFYDTPNFRWQA